MNVTKRIVVTALSLAGALAAGAAQARGNFDVSVQIGTPGFVLGLPLPPLPHVVITPSRGYSPAYGQPVYGQPVYGQPVYGHGPVGYGDRDRDGIPNRYDRAYNPRWDRDGDGVPNRYDRKPNRPSYGHPVYHDQRGGGASHGRDHRGRDGDGRGRDGDDRRGDGRRGGRD